MLTDVDDSIADPELVAASPEGDEVADEEDWETEPQIVGLTDARPEVAAETKIMMQEGPEPESPRPVWQAEGEQHVGSKSPDPTVIARLAKPKMRDSTPINPDFKPKLIGSAKKRAAVKGTGYGTKVIQKKYVKEEDIPKPDFKPKTNFGKGSAAKRNASPGSQYGKKTAQVKAKAPAELTFTPTLAAGAVGQKLRAKTKSRILDASKKAAEKGKKLRSEHELAQQQKRAGFECGRYTLAADKGEEVVEEVASGMDFTSSPLHTLDPSSVAHTKTGAKLVKGAKSHYTSSVYKPAVGEKAEKPKEEPRWEIGKVAAAENEADTINASPTSKKTSLAKSHYSTAAYKPKQGEKPEKKPKSEVDWVAPVQAPHVISSTVIGKSLEELDEELKEVRKPGQKFTKVESSGYGVKSPVPNIEAKVASYKNRSTSGMLRSSDFKSKSQDENSVVNAENVRPVTPLGAEGATLINDLLSRAASMDSKAAAASASTAPAPPNVAAVAVATAGDGGDDEETTML